MAGYGAAPHYRSVGDTSIRRIDGEYADDARDVLQHQRNILDARIAVAVHIRIDHADAGNDNNGSRALRTLQTSF